MIYYISPGLLAVSPDFLYINPSINKHGQDPGGKEHHGKSRSDQKANKDQRLRTGQKKLFPCWELLAYYLLLLGFGLAASS